MVIINISNCCLSLPADGVALEQVKPSASNQLAFTWGNSRGITAVNVSIMSARTIIKFKLLLDLNFF